MRIITMNTISGPVLNCTEYLFGNLLSPNNGFHCMVTEFLVSFFTVLRVARSFGSHDKLVWETQVSSVDHTFCIINFFHESC